MRKMLAARDFVLAEKRKLALEELDEVLVGLGQGTHGAHQEDGVTYGFNDVTVATEQQRIVPKAEEKYEDPDALLDADDKRKLAKDLARSVDQRQHLFHQ